MSDSKQISANYVATGSVAPPSNVTLSKSTANNVLNWTATPSTAATGYAVYRAATTGGPYTQIGTVSGRTTTTFTDTAVPPSKPSYYVVTALDYNWFSGQTSESSAAASPYPNYVLRDAPIGYWRLGEASGSVTLVDSSGHGRNATNNGLILGQPSLVPKITDTSANADGTGTTYATVPFDPGLNPATGITIEAWIRTPANFGTPANDWRAILGKDSAGSRDYVLFAHSADGVNVTGLHFASAPWGYDQFDFSSPLAPNTIHYVAVSIDRGMGGTQTFYLDGVAYGAGASGGTGSAMTNSPVKIAAAGNFWNGGIDEVALYDHGLTAAQIADHYKAGTS